MTEDIYSRTDFDPEKAERVCALIGEGAEQEDGTPKRLSETEICREVGISIRTLRVWLATYPVFQANYEQARQLYADRLIEEAIMIADDVSNDTYVHTTEKGQTTLKLDSDNVARAKLRVDTRIKVASKLFPARYGDKLQINSTNTTVHIDETTAGKRLRARNIIEDAKKQGYSVKEILAEMGLTEVNLLPEDYSPETQGAGQKLLEEPQVIRIPMPTKSARTKTKA